MEKVTLQIDVKNFFVIKKVHNAIPWKYVIENFNGQEIIGTFYQKKIAKANKHSLAFKK